jgi:hypothetical protein
MIDLFEMALIVAADVCKHDKAPSEQIDKPVRPELQRDTNGLWPGQKHPLDIPAFLDRRNGKRPS